MASVCQRCAAGDCRVARVGAVLCAALLLLSAGPVQGATAQPNVIGVKAFPGGEPLAVAVHQGRDKLFISEDDAGALHVLDGTSLATLNTVPVGGSALEIAVNETHEKVYVASSRNAGTPALTDGTGLISVIDAETNQLLKTINPGTHTSPSFFVLANNEVTDKIYVAFKGGIGVIDAATDAYTALATMTTFASNAAVNTVKNKVYFDLFGSNSVVVIDGAATPPTPAVSTMSLGFTGGSGPLDLAVSEPENKLYVTMLLVPGQGEIGILIIDLDTNAHSFTGAEDLEPLVFNQATNRLFAGVQVGQRGAIVDGATDALSYVDLGGAGIGESALRISSDNAYHASSTHTFAVNGATRCSIALATGGAGGGGLVVTDVAVNQATGRVYVTNDQVAGKVTVIADGAVPCDTQPPETTIDSGPSGTVPSAPLAFTFSSSEPGSTFECRLDAGAFAACTSPYVTAALPAGPHTFEVRASDKAGNTDPTPASRSFTVGTLSSPSATAPAFPPPPAFPVLARPITGAVVDDRPPALELGGSTSQRVLRRRGVVIVVSCLDEPCTVRARASVAVPRPARTYRLRPASARIPEGGEARLRLAASRQALMAIGRALRRGRRLTARVTVTATDAEGNTATRRRAIRLRR